MVELDNYIYYRIKNEKALTCKQIFNGIAGQGEVSFSTLYIAV